MDRWEGRRVMMFNTIHGAWHAARGRQELNLLAHHASPSGLLMAGDMPCYSRPASAGFIRSAGVGLQRVVPSPEGFVT